MLRIVLLSLPPIVCPDHCARMYYPFPRILTPCRRLALIPRPKIDDGQKKTRKRPMSLRMYYLEEAARFHGWGENRQKDNPA